MKFKIIFLLVISGLLIQCKKEKSKTNTSKIEKISAVNDYDFGGKMKFEFYSDSSYIFTIIEKSPDYEKIEKFSGICYFKKDTIYFNRFPFKYNRSEKAVIKNNFIEFIQPNFPLRIEIKKNLFQIKSKLDFRKYSDYAIFTFDHKFYGIYFNDNPEKLKPYDLNQAELIEVDQIIKKCFTENNSKLRKIDTYIKQCIAVINEKQEKEVLIKCYCKSFNTEKSFKYFLIDMSDGGNCNISLKINLTKHTYSELNIAGRA
ncbi:hypothetical protein [Flavobacterium reichenbachii]|uniref:Uncharacterized protein n=1 Tax=Flavobacterium reichenbachii TaxID=362418 RepID=A0A085ZKT5_9FLAO|nr:hypothetical protein [Flavobacterium reichenbachii]KFF05049.1 hypothetical protein IW19_05680 [Flavobacterium reichenbachii]OXB16279.1 hypothetical protein B0A68_08470 [Flavobacterium reichenbachii]